MMVVSAYGHPMFARRRGTSPMWEEAVYEKQQTEEAVRKLKDLGVTLSILPFFFGYGLEAESEVIADSRKLATLLKSYGIQVGVYVGSTIMYETFLLEKPEAQEWFVQDYLGRPVIYSNQTWRKRVYFMHPGYREYMKRVLRVAVEDLKVDMVHFDNTSMQAARPIFQHPMAVEDFREFLRIRYSTKGLKERFGISSVRYVEPPRFEQPLSMIDDPLFQDWAEFRCLQLARYYGEMKEFIVSLNPKVVIATNPSSGISGVNVVWDQGVDYPALLPQMDFVWSEEGDYAGARKDGVLVSKIRSYKMANTLGKRLLTYTTHTLPGEGTFADDIPGGPVDMAESMAYNRQCLGNIGGGLAGYDEPILGLPVSFGPTREERKYIRFFREHFDLYRAVSTRADVAILYSHATMGFNNDRPAVSFMLVSQTLIQAKLPFDLVFDQQLRQLEKYKVLVLADQECLSDAELALIGSYVRQGGGLVATEHTSLYTEWRRRRLNFGLEDLFQVQAPPWAGMGEPDRILSVGITHHQIGKGRVVYVPEVKAAMPKPRALPMTSPYWKLPTNWEDLAAAVRWAAGEELSVEVKAPLTVAAELLEQAETGTLLLHLINYDAKRTPRQENIKVRLHLAAKPGGISVLSPDRESVETIDHTWREGKLDFTVPILETYNVVVIK
jgi:hypothetical protein